MKDSGEILTTFKDDLAMAEKRLQSLHDKQKESWDLLVNKEFEMDATKGDYDCVTTNKATTLGNKVIGKLAKGRPAFSYKLETESEAERVRLSKSERFVYAAFGKADKQLKSPVAAGSIHGALSFYAPIFGGVIPRVILWVDKDKEVVFDVVLFNPYFTYWAIGADGLSWIAQKRWASTDEIEELYPDVNIQPDAAKEGYVEVYDYLNSQYEGVIISKDSWAEEPFEHKIGHVPALVLPAGSRPLVQMGDNDEVAHSWVSVFDNNRHLYPVESKLMSLRATMLRTQVNRPFIHKYDSTKGGSAKDLESNPALPGSIAQIDVGKGEDLIPSISMTLTRDMEIAEKQIESQILMGGMSPISFGQGESGQPAAAVAMLLDADADIFNPFKKCIENAEQWIAMELIHQLKNGKFKKVIETEGFNDKNKRFSVKVDIAELEDKKEIICELQMSSKVESMQDVGMAKQLTDGEDPLISRQTARDSLLQSLVPDTDEESRRVAQEKVLKLFPELQALLTISALIEDRGGRGKAGKDDLIQILLNKYEEMKNKSAPQPAEDVQPPGVQPPGMMPGMMPGMQSPMNMVSPMQQPPVPVPPGVSNAIRLNKMGLSYAGR